MARIDSLILLEFAALSTHLMTNKNTHWTHTTQHEANLTTGVGRDSTVGIVYNFVDLFTKLMQVFDEIKMKPYTFTCRERQK